jgi:hypothetical protein
MPLQLETLKRWQWLIATAVLIALLLVAMAYRVNAQQRQSPAQAPGFYEGLQLDAKLLALDKTALDEAYHQQLVKLWIIWVTDGAPAADRIKSGLRIARRAYDEARDSIQERERHIQKAQP